MVVTPFPEHHRGPTIGAPVRVGDVLPLTDPMVQEEMEATVFGGALCPAHVGCAYIATALAVISPEAPFKRTSIHLATNAMVADVLSLKDKDGAKS